MQASVRRCGQEVFKKASIYQHLSNALASGKGTGASNPVQVNGWVKSVRRQKNVSFVNLNDGSTHETLQAVIPADLEKHEGSLAGLQTGCSVTMIGRLTEKYGGRKATSTQLPSDRYELQVEQLKLVGACDNTVSPEFVLLCVPIV